MDTQIQTQVVVANNFIAESWAAIPGFAGLEASTLGRIRSFSRPDRAAGLPYKVRKLSAGTLGYLTTGYNGKTYNVHCLVALAFFGPKPAGMCVLHANDVRDDNRVSNLRYGTYADNYRDSVANGGRYKGPNPRMFGNRSSLTAANVRTIRRQLAAGMTPRQIASAHGVSPQAIRSIRAGKAFSWVADTAAATQLNIDAAALARATARVTLAKARLSQHSAPKAAPVSIVKGAN